MCQWIIILPFSRWLNWFRWMLEWWCKKKKSSQRSHCSDISPWLRPRKGLFLELLSPLPPGHILSKLPKNNDIFSSTLTSGIYLAPVQYVLLESWNIPPSFYCTCYEHPKDGSLFNKLTSWHMICLGQFLVTHFAKFPCFSGTRWFTSCLQMTTTQSCPAWHHPAILIDNPF